MYQRYRDYGVDPLPDWLAMILGVIVLLLVATVTALLLVGRRRRKSPEERARAAAGKASRSRQADLRKRRLALQEKAGRRDP
ncbi:hypothetical protein ACFY8O_10385 [Streptomyces argenteolus]|uniref:LPXTG-motif cell wall-anchored protein n=1 Tax=Streptomyces argenteolus TaxID=67274 RepID=A0ABW6X2Q2_9ACTN